MIKNLVDQQIASRHPFFAQQLTKHLSDIDVPAKPAVFAAAFNQHYKTKVAKPHTVRKWLIGETQPKSETLLLLAKWLKVDPKDLISLPNEPVDMTNKVSFEFDFTDQEVIAKYLAMTIKQKVTVRLLIDAITDKDR